MKRNSFPQLLEQLVMVLTLAVAAAVCLRLFAAADTISRQSRMLDRAVLAAQTAAQTLKSGGEYIGSDEGDLSVTVTALPGEIPGLGQAEIAVYDDSGNLIYTLTAAWQEAAP